MPLSVSCPCGKEFKVFEELAGTDVRCLACGKMCRVGAAEGEVEAEALMDYPEKLGPEERAAILAGVIEGIRQQPATLDAGLSGGFLSGKSAVLMALCGLGLVSFVAGLAIRGGEAFIVIGILTGMILGIPLIVSLVNDNKASHIQDAPTAQEALSRYLMAVKTGRRKKAYAALVPSSRTASEAETIQFKNPKIANVPKRMAFSDAAGFASYWKYNFTGPSMNTRNVTISKVRSVSNSSDGVEIVEATIKTTSHSSLLFLLVFVHVLIAAVVIFAIQARDEATVRKALFRHNGLWYILDGAFQGELDRAI